MLYTCAPPFAENCKVTQDLWGLVEFVCLFVVNTKSPIPKGTEITYSTYVYVQYRFPQEGSWYFSFQEFSLR